MQRIDEMEPLLVSTRRRLHLDDDWTGMLMHVLRQSKSSNAFLMSLSGDRYRRGIRAWWPITNRLPYASFGSVPLAGEGQDVSQR